ncbi:Arc family DNA-binding protein [Devosia limi]|uniref:Arc family DNA-binding protein n=1 Tax=Devosia limi TaxID=288995 RepID=UPI0009320CB0
MYPSTIADKFVIRLPAGLRDRIKQHAAANHRTMNAEIIHHLDAVLGKAKGPAEAPTSPSHDQNPSPARNESNDART